jgi:ATP-binding cassette subfamily B protein
VTRRLAFSDVRLYARLLRQARGCWRHIGLMFFLSLLATPLMLLTPLPIKIAVDSIIGNQPLPGFLDPVLPAAATDSEHGLFLLVAVLVVGIALLTQVQSLGAEVLGAYIGERLLLKFRGELFRRVQRLSLSYHDTIGSADSLYRIQYDAPAIQWIAVHGITPFLTHGLTLVGMTYIAFRLDWQLAVVALSIVPFLAFATAASRRRLRSGWMETKTLETSAMAVVQEVLTGLRLVKAFGQEEREHRRFVDRSGEGMRARIRLAFLEGAFGMFLAVTVAVGTAAVLVIGARHVQTGVLTLGELLLLMAYLAQLYVPLQLIATSVGALQASLASAERAFALLDQAVEVDEWRHARRLDRAAGAVEFRKVSFSYGAEPVLEDISFEVPRGTRLGIVGASGSGKTTLASLLMRFYDPTAGAILLDGVDIRYYRVADLRRQFAIVLQEPVLLATTVAENIAYARPDATPEEIAEAAKAANAHDFIVELPYGYSTEVGERGFTLSGGERQRISLARAFLTDAPVLILDEPTSALDVRTEARIVDAMERLMVGRTVLLITHRVSALSACDAYLELQDGRVERVSPVEREEPAA